MSQTTAPVSAELLALVRRAIADPGGTLPRKDGETVPAWSARAVVETLAQLLDPADLPARIKAEIERVAVEHGKVISFRELAEAAGSVRWEAGAQAVAAAAVAAQREDHAVKASVEQRERADQFRRERDEARNALTGLEMYLAGVESHCSANRRDVPSWVGSVRAAMGGGE